MKTSDFNYNLPPKLIAQKPLRPRDSSRMMVVDRANKTIEHKNFYDIVDYLKKGDLVVWNNSKVFKARLFGTLISEDDKPLKRHTKPIEIFLVRPMENPGVWTVLAKPGRHLQNGTKIRFAENFYCDAITKKEDGTFLVQFFRSNFKEDILNEEEVRAEANKYGHVPLPPYIKDEKHELETYQTVYAQHEGSVAAPTAGFHFTPELIERLKELGVEFAHVTLHVGLGTFLPVKTERVEDHTMHSEWIELTQENAEKINLAKKENRRVVAVGTTTIRTLEGVALLISDNGSMGQWNNNKNRDNATHLVRPYSGDINLFITPGFEFKVVDALITNFHLPKSTLLMLVCAFVGDTQFVLQCYKEAVKEKYRFYSFGDAMFIQ